MMSRGPRRAAHPCPALLSGRWVLARLPVHNKSSGQACGVGVVPGNPVEKGSPDELRPAVIFLRIRLVLQNCDLAKLASVKHFVVLAWLRKEC